MVKYGQKQAGNDLLLVVNGNLPLEHQFQKKNSQLSMMTKSHSNSLDVKYQ